MWGSPWGQTESGTTEQLHNHLITKLWFFTEALYIHTIVLSSRGRIQIFSSAENGQGIFGDGYSHSESLCFRLVVSEMKRFLKNKNKEHEEVGSVILNPGNLFELSGELLFIYFFWGAFKMYWSLGPT